MLKILLRNFLWQLWVVCCGKGRHCKENPQVYLRAFMLFSPGFESYSYSQLNETRIALWSYI